MALINSLVIRLWYCNGFCPAAYHLLHSTLCWFICRCGRLIICCLPEWPPLQPSCKDCGVWGRWSQGGKCHVHWLGVGRKVPVSIRRWNSLERVSALLMRWENIWWWRALPLLVRCPEEDPAMVLSDTILLVLVMGEVQMTLATLRTWVLVPDGCRPRKHLEQEC